MTKINNLFLVDDDDVYQFLTQRIIESTDLVNKIRIFSNGREALNFISEKADKPDEIPDLILLDLAMPVMDGWEFLEAFLALQPKLGRKIDLYIVSSSTDPHDVERAMAIKEVKDFVVKPVTRSKFVELIEELA